MSGLWRNLEWVPESLRSKGPAKTKKMFGFLSFIWPQCCLNWIPNQILRVWSRALKFWEKVHLLPPVLCHMSRVTCHVSHVTYHMSHVFFLKVTKLVCGGSLVNDADSIKFWYNLWKRILVTDSIIILKKIWTTPMPTHPVISRKRTL